MGAFGAILLSIGYRKFTIPGFFDNLIKSLEITVLIMFLVAALDIHGLNPYDPMVWFGILVTVNLQTAWLSPPVALSAYFLKGVVPEWDLKDIYLGMMQFMVLQIIGLIIIIIFPKIVLWLPTLLYGQ